jgi:hypothetical protein
MIVMVVRLMNQRIRLFNYSGSPTFRLLMVVLNCDDYYDFASNFIQDTVGKPIDYATPHSRRQWRPSFRVMIYTLHRVPDFFRKLKTQSKLLSVIIVYRVVKLRLSGVKKAPVHLARRCLIRLKTSSAGIALSSPRS